MTNDAKLGMLAGVLGVLFAAVFLAKPGEQSAAPEPQVQAQPAALPSVPASAPNPGPALADAKPSALPATPVARTRKEIVGQPAGRNALADEEP